jgi:hypothetical protein
MVPVMVGMVMVMGVGARCHKRVTKSRYIPSCHRRPRSPEATSSSAKDSPEATEEAIP